MSVACYLFFVFLSVMSFYKNTALIKSKEPYGMYINKNVDPTCANWVSRFWTVAWSVEGRTATKSKSPKIGSRFSSCPSIPSCSFYSSTFFHHSISIPPSTAHSPMTQTLASHLDIRCASLGSLRIFPDDLIVRAIFSVLGPKVISIPLFVSFLLRYVESHMARTLATKT